MRFITTRVMTAAFVLSLAFTGLVTPVAYAAEGESIALSPTNKRYTVDPGATITDTFSVINDGTESYIFNVYARPYSVKDSSYAPDFGRLAANTDVYRWVQFDKTQYELEPGEEAKIPFTMRVPENTDSGGHYGVLFAETQPKDGGTGSVVRKKRVGAIVYTTVKGDNQNEGRVDSSNISFLQVHSPLKASSYVTNSGNVDFVDTTKVVVKDIFGNEKFSNERALAVLPSTSRAMEYKWENGPVFGLYNVTISHSLLGKNVNTSSFVLLAPIWLLILLGIVIVAAISYALARRTMKTTTSKKHAKANKN